MKFANLVCVETCKENPDYIRSYVREEVAELLAELYTRKYAAKAQGIQIRFTVLPWSDVPRVPSSVTYSAGGHVSTYLYDWHEAK